MTWKISDAVFHCKTHIKTRFQITHLKYNLKFIWNLSEIWMAVGASGATEGDALVFHIGFLAVARAIRKVWTVALLVGCDIAQSGMQWCNQGSMQGAENIAYNVVGMPSDNSVCKCDKNNYLVVSNPRTTWPMNTLDPDHLKTMEMLCIMLMYLCQSGFHQGDMYASVVNHQTTPASMTPWHGNTPTISVTPTSQTPNSARVAWVCAPWLALVENMWML